MKTTHEIGKAPGQDTRVSVEHRYSKAVQYDFYVPTLLWDVPEVRTFFDTLAALGGATVFERQTGIWKGEKEKTDVVRLLIRPGDLPAGRVREALRREVGQLMATLSGSEKFAQQTMMYTETVVTVVVAENVTRID